MTIRTILNFGDWDVTKHFQCETCKEHFIFRRQIHSGFKYSSLFEAECISHAEFCKLMDNARKIVEKYCA